jgi:hypothetical protein
MLYNKAPEQRSILVFRLLRGQEKVGCHFYEFVGAKGMLASPPHKLLRGPRWPSAASSTTRHCLQWPGRIVGSRGADNEKEAICHLLRCPAQKPSLQRKQPSA